MLLVAAIAFIWIPIANTCNAFFIGVFVKCIPIANTLTTAVVWIRKTRDTLCQEDAGNLIAKSTQN